MHPREEYGERFWEEVRLLERIVGDVDEEPVEERVRKINWFLSEQCDELSLGHSKCLDLIDEASLVPVYESIEDFDRGDPQYLGCYECGEMYRSDSDEMPPEFEELRISGAIRAGTYNYGRTKN